MVLSRIGCDTMETNLIYDKSISIDTIIEYLKCIASDQLNDYNQGQDANLIRAYAVQGILQLSQTGYDLHVVPRRVGNDYVIRRMNLIDRAGNVILYQFYDDRDEECDHQWR